MHTQHIVGEMYVGLTIVQQIVGETFARKGQLLISSPLHAEKVM
jgi:hypothetical protein